MIIDVEHKVILMRERQAYLNLLWSFATEAVSQRTEIRLRNDVEFVDAYQGLWILVGEGDVDDSLMVVDPEDVLRLQVEVILIVLNLPLVLSLSEVVKQQENWLRWFQFHLVFEGYF